MWKPVDIIALTMAIAVAFIVTMTSVVSGVTGRILSEEKAAMLVGLLRDMINLLYAYVGFKFGQNNSS